MAVVDRLDRHGRAGARWWMGTPATVMADPVVQAVYLGPEVVA